jgi:hypothetical protein
MTQVAQPHVRVSLLRSRRGLVLAALGALVAGATTLTLVIAIGTSPTETSIPRTAPSATGLDAGPVAGTPIAVSQALRRSEPRFIPPSSLTTNVPAPPRADAGPATGTPIAVRDAFSAQ